VDEASLREALLAEAADEALELDSDHATPTLKRLVCGVPPLEGYVKYHDAYLRRWGDQRGMGGRGGVSSQGLVKLTQ
jgi:hypothetical protein